MPRAPSRHGSVRRSLEGSLEGSLDPLHLLGRQQSLDEGAEQGRLPNELGILGIEVPHGRLGIGERLLGRPELLLRPCLGVFPLEVLADHDQGHE